MVLRMEWKNTPKAPPKHRDNPAVTCVAQGALAEVLVARAAVEAAEGADRGSACTWLQEAKQRLTCAEEAWAPSAHLGDAGSGCWPLQLMKGLQGRGGAGSSTCIGCVWRRAWCMRVAAGGQAAPDPHEKARAPAAQAPGGQHAGFGSRTQALLNNKVA